MKQEKIKQLVMLINFYGLNCIEFGKRMEKDEETEKLSKSNEVILKSICDLLEDIGDIKLTREKVYLN